MVGEGVDTNSIQKGKRLFASITIDLLLLLIAAVLTVQSTIITKIASEFALNKISTGYLFTSNFLGFAFFIVLGGFAADFLGKKRVLLVALLSMAICLSSFLVLKGYVLIGVVYFLIGGACGIIESIASAYLAELNPRRESFHINLSQVFFCVGALIGPFGSSLLIKAEWNWRSIYAIISGMSIIVAILFYAALRSIQTKKYTQSLNISIIKKYVTNKYLLVLCLCMFLYTGSEIGAWSWMVTFMMERLDFSIVESSLAVGIFWISMLLGRMICTLALKKRSAQDIVIFLSIASVFTTVFSAVASNRALAWIATILLGFSYSSIWPLIISFGSEYMDDSSGTIFSLMVGSGGLGSAIIPVFIGYLGQNFSLKISMISPAVFFVVIAISILRLSRGQKTKKVEV
jgi:FHS family glucose/mannose:H+ symporter-like MFS transporter